ncbi:MAG TPA: hypothetical protein VKR60_09700 [Candidatus Sulfotelmatobacter sp.]|nr:hypothetical protein [Candidatus Sulfotelmatobacter sp.]
MTSFRSGLLLLSLTACLANAQYIGTLDRPIGSNSKFENGLFLSWVMKSDDPSMKQVEIFDMTGRSLADLEVLRPVPDARLVGIYDVSARPGGVIAVAAVYASKQQVPPTAALLLFDFGGRLLSVFALASSRQICRVEVDSQSHIWTITDHADRGEDPSTVPVVVEYSAAGEEEKRVLTRNMFPIEARRFEQSSFIGSPSIGLDSGILWFWLPRSTNLVTISTGDGKYVTVKTGLPPTETEITPDDVFRLDSGDLVGQFIERGKDGTLRSVYYKWSLSTGWWSKFKPSACDGDRLTGVNGKKQVYTHYRAESRAADICTYQLR